MKTKAFVLLILASVLTLRVSSRIAVAFSVSQPHESKLKTIRLAFTSPYEIASPHMSSLAGCQAQDVSHGLRTGLFRGQLCTGL